MTAFTVRTTLPPDWYELGRDDPGGWLQETVPALVPDPQEQDALADELIDLYGLADLLGAVDVLAELPAPTRRLRALLLTYPWTARRPWRRGLDGYADAVQRDVRRRGATDVARERVEVAGRPAVRLRGECLDELGRPCDHVLHVLLPAGAPGAVVQRVQWSAGRADAAELSRTADDIARSTLVEVLG